MSEERNARKREERRRRTAEMHGRGLTLAGNPLTQRALSAVHHPRDHVGEVEAGLALGLDLAGIASDMGVKPSSLVTVLRRKGAVDLVRRLGIPDTATAAATRRARQA